MNPTKETIILGNLPLPVIRDPYASWAAAINGGSSGFLHMKWPDWYPVNFCRKLYHQLCKSELWASEIKPEHSWVFQKVCGILAEGFASVRSLVEECCVDTNGRAIPWYTYPAIEYLGHVDFSECAVFEYGVGASTLWWAERAKRVVAVESTPGGLSV